MEAKEIQKSIILSSAIGGTFDKIPLAFWG